MVDRDYMGSWSVYACFDRVSGLHVATIYGPDTAGWSVATRGALTNRGWGAHESTLAFAKDAVEQRMLDEWRAGRYMEEMEGSLCLCGARFGMESLGVDDPEFRSHLHWAQRQGRPNHGLTDRAVSPARGRKPAPIK